MKELESVDALAAVVADDAMYTKEERTRSESPDGGDTRGQPVIDHRVCGGECTRDESPDGGDTRGNPVIDHRVCVEWRIESRSCGRPWQRKGACWAGKSQCALCAVARQHCVQ